MYNLPISDAAFCVREFRMILCVNRDYGRRKTQSKITVHAHIRREVTIVLAYRHNKTRKELILLKPHPDQLFPMTQHY
jgi:hypothetical protein